MLVTTVGLLTVSMIFLPTKNSTISRIERLTVVEIPIAQGLGFTAIRSGTGMGVEVRTNGGSLRGKKTSLTLSHRLDQIGFSSNVLPIRASRSSWSSAMTTAASLFESACVNKVFAIVVAGSANLACPTPRPPESFTSLRPDKSLCLTGPELVSRSIVTFSRQLSSNEQYSGLFKAPINNRRRGHPVCYPKFVACPFTLVNEQVRTTPRRNDARSAGVKGDPYLAANRLSDEGQSAAERT